MKSTLESIVTALETSKRLQESGVMGDREPLFVWMNLSESSKVIEHPHKNDSGVYHTVLDGDNFYTPCWTMSELIEELGDKLYSIIQSPDTKKFLVCSFNNNTYSGNVKEYDTPIQALANLLEAINE